MASRKKLSDNISCFADCYGCGVCEISCPHKAIRIELCSDGFYHPHVDERECTHCGICLATCAYADDSVAQKQDFPIKAYAAWSKRPLIRKVCSSGGVGFELASAYLKEGYKACGVKYDTEYHRAEHFIADSEITFIPSIGSKYIPSFPSPGLSKLKRGEKYIFFGTPCQIDSMRRYAAKYKIEDSFTLVDFFCHGVPSMTMWKKYLKTIPKSVYDAGVVRWRNKANGWHDSWIMTVSPSDSDVGECNTQSQIEHIIDQKPQYSSNMRDGDLFYYMFLCNNCLAKPCYNRCKYKMTHSAADIRIGDLWGKKYSSEENGVSAVLALTKKGVDTLNDCMNIHIHHETIETVTEGQMRECAKWTYIAGVDKCLLRLPFSLKNIVKANHILPKIMYPIMWLRSKIKK